MDSAWLFRQAYNTARHIKESQDAFCTKAEAGEWDELGDATFPEDLQWESLFDVLRVRFGFLRFSPTFTDQCVLQGKVRVSKFWFH
jgi:hypothetical protein